MNTDTDGTTTARGKKKTDWTLWHRPARGTHFLMDWGTEEAMRQKLAEMQVEPPASETETITAPACAGSDK